VTEEPELKPLQPIRRYDVFAETKRLEPLAHGEPEDVARGYGIRIAKIVASRRFGGSAAKKTRHEKAATLDGESEKASRFGGEGAPSSEPSTAKFSPMTRLTERSSTEWVPSFTRSCSNQRCGMP
jgi:hypothetical protein